MRKSKAPTVTTAEFAETIAAMREMEATIARYERALKAIRDSKLTGVDFGDWIQCVVEDVLDGGEAECPECGTVVHEGPCVSESGE